MTNQLISYLQKKYRTSPEHPWIRFPGYTVFRHADNQKWFALIVDIPRDTLGMDGQEPVDVLNVKIQDPLLMDLLIQQPEYYRGYHWLLLFGPMVATHRFFHTLNRVERELNKRNGGHPNG